MSKSFQRGEDPQFDQLISCFHAVAEHALPALLRTLFAWYDRQNVDYHNVNVPPEAHKQKSEASKTGSGSTKSMEMMEKEHLMNKRNLAVDYLFALVLIELLKQVSIDFSAFPVYFFYFRFIGVFYSCLFILDMNTLLCKLNALLSGISNTVIRKWFYFNETTERYFKPIFVSAELLSVQIVSTSTLCQTYTPKSLVFLRSQGTVSFRPNITVPIFILFY